MTTNSQLVTVANENFVASYVKLVERCTGSEARRIGGIFAFATGLPISLFNGCVVVEPSAPTDLDDAIDWVAAHLVPYRVFVSPGSRQSSRPSPQRMASSVTRCRIRGWCSIRSPSHPSPLPE